MSKKKGDTITLDCGYAGEPFADRLCRLLEDPHEVAPLFDGDKPTLCARVEILGTGEVFNATLP